MPDLGAFMALVITILHISQLQNFNFNINSCITRILMWLMKLLLFTEAKRIKVISSSFLIDSSLWQSTFQTEQKSRNSQVSSLRPIFLSLQNFGPGYFIIFLVIYQIIWLVTISNVCQLCVHVCKFYMYRQITDVAYIIKGLLLADLLMPQRGTITKNHKCL